MLASPSQPGDPRLAPWRNWAANIQRNLTAPELREHGSDLAIEPERRRPLDAMTGLNQVRKEFRRERQDGEIPRIDDERPLTEPLCLPVVDRDQAERARGVGSPWCRRRVEDDRGRRLGMLCRQDVTDADFRTGEVRQLGCRIAAPDELSRPIRWRHRGMPATSRRSWTSRLRAARSFLVSPGTGSDLNLRMVLRKLGCTTTVSSRAFDLRILRTSSRATQSARNQSASDFRPRLDTDVGTVHPITVIPHCLGQAGRPPIVCRSYSVPGPSNQSCQRPADPSPPRLLRLDS